MKHFLCILIFLGVVISGRGTDEPLIPEALNALLSKITAGMTPEEVSKLLSTAYPKLQRADGGWSGQGGWIGFRLDERYTVEVSAYNDTKNRVFISTNPALSVFDGMAQVRFDITRFDWGAASREKKPNYPYGIPVKGRPGFVRSPYPKEESDMADQVDVRGVPKGTELRDPNNNKIFLIP
jgi:hypothetical protein